MTELRKLQEDGPRDDEIRAAVEADKRDMETAERTNSYWLHTCAVCGINNSAATAVHVPFWRTFVFISFFFVYLFVHHACMHFRVFYPTYCLSTARALVESARCFFVRFLAKRGSMLYPNQKVEKLLEKCNPRRKTTEITHGIDTPKDNTSNTMVGFFDDYWVKESANFRKFLARKAPPRS